MAISRVLVAAGLLAAPMLAQEPIKIGTITPETGKYHQYAAVTRAEGAYFRMINDRGGIHGRKIEFISLDNGSDAAVSLSLTRKLIEQDGVLLIFSSFGTEANLAIRSYLNEHKVPQLFVQSSSAVFDDPAHFPWTMGFFATYKTEGRGYGQYILRSKPNARIGVLYANDDSGREFLDGIRLGLGDRAASMMVKTVSYEDSDDTLAEPIRALKESGADVLLNMAVGPFATRAIRRVSALDWHPLQFIPNASLSVAAFLEPAGLAQATGIISNARSKGWATPEARRDPAVRDFLEWMRTYNPDASLRDQDNVAGYERAQALVEVLKKCGSDLTRENVMKQAASLNLELPMLRSGIRIQTSSSDYQPIKQLYLVRFDGQSWVPFGPIIAE